MRFVGSFFIGLALNLSLAHAAEVLVKTDTISISGASYVESDLSNFYGGFAGTCTTNPDARSTCDTCASEKSTLQACNKASLHPNLNFSVSFRPTKDVTGIARMYFLNASDAQVGTPVSLTSASYTTSSTVTLPTTWASICNAVGLTNCGVSSGTTGIYVGKIAIGIDSDGSGDIDLTNEVKKIPFKIHYIAPNDPAVANNYCASTATPGFCKINFEPGDAKVYVKEEPEADQPVTGGADTIGGNTIEFDSIAIFPVKVANETDTSGNGATITGFKTGNASVSPIFVPISPTDNTDIKNAEVSGGLENYQTYCFIYGNRNKAGNIYRFVAGTPATDAATIATQICKTPSEVVGLLEDKHCFISTAAFGSDMAAEVQTFREFRNQYLLTNTLGQMFVKTYYKVSPPIADFIAKSDALRAATRTALYPFLVFSSIALKFGLAAALLTLLSLLILIFKIKSVVKQKRLLVFLVILMLAPTLKAQITPKTTVIQHPESQEGLVRITKDGTYIYDIKREMKSESSRISVGHALQPEVTIDIEQRDASGNGTNTFQTYNFGDLYEETSSIIIGYDYEKFPWIGKKGKLGWQLGGSIMFAQGHGILVSKAATNDYKSREKYTFFTIPLTAGAVYRFEWKDKQLFAPYVAGGGTYTALIEKREDKSAPQFTGAPGFYGAGGVLFNLSQLDDESGYALDSEYGISNLWLSLEFKVIEVNSDSFTFSNQYANLGISFDF